MLSVCLRFSIHFLIISIILECNSRLFYSTYFDSILCLAFEREFEGKSTKFIDKAGNLNLLHFLRFHFSLVLLASQYSSEEDSAAFSSNKQLCKE